MLRTIVSIAYVISGAGMFLLLVALVGIVVGAGTFSGFSISLTSWQGVLLLGSMALLIASLSIVWFGLFTLGCSTCKTSLFEPSLVAKRSWSSWFPGARPLELFVRYLSG